MAGNKGIVTPASPATSRTAVAGGVAVVISDVDVWSAAAARVLQDVGLKPWECHELHEAMDFSYEEPIALLIVAAPTSEFMVRACRSVRGLQEVPLIAMVSMEDDVVDALEAGADDAVPANASAELLAARVRALLRRASRQERAGGVLQVREICIDLNKCQVVVREQPVNLTPTEFRLLACLAQRAGRVVDSRTLLKAVHGYLADERDAQSVVKVHIANIRRKLEVHLPEQPYILSVRGFGYLLERRTQPRENDPLSPLIDSTNGDEPSSPAS
ncbi:MAG: winged helix-turn-helix domain-containing protein [Chloroflexi bacterium]|nr:winged helix-turn-helix domain-containing protein [Chloroflexota bacterium]